MLVAFAVSHDLSIRISMLYDSVPAGSEHAAEPLNGCPSDCSDEVSLGE
jgi:hypothetical protein